MRDLRPQLDPMGLTAIPEVGAAPLPDLESVRTRPRTTTASRGRSNSPFGQPGVAPAHPLLLYEGSGSWGSREGTGQNSNLAFPVPHALC